MTGVQTLLLCMRVCECVQFVCECAVCVLMQLDLWICWLFVCRASMRLLVEYNMMFGVSVMGFIVCGLDEA